jgi:hypothetical protein
MTYMYHDITDSGDISEDLGGDNDNQLARDRDHRSIKPP